MRLVVAPDRRLRQRAAPLDLVGDQRWPRERLGRTIMGMLDTMYRHEGVGLAAPQVGVPFQILVVDPWQDRHQAKVLINPEIVWRSPETSEATEGCLSLPGQRGLVTRATAITIRYYDAEYFPSELKADDLLARVLQHECEHLAGVLFTDPRGTP